MFETNVPEGLVCSYCMSVLKAEVLRNVNISADVAYVSHMSK